MSEPKPANALAGEFSPYLRQHAHNPVQWHPWSQSALQKARELDKPILLSIGYAACHWCHVMERESFENEDIAALMNEFFINIKVDREERPDLDAVYMQAVQTMTGRGGWPMTVFLTPDQVPFYCGTYFPPQDRHGMPGFPRVLRSVGAAYRERKAGIIRDAEAILAELQQSSRLPAAQGALTPDLLDQAAKNVMANYDSQNGGFGGAPKFPPSMSLDFLMRSYARTRSAPYLDAVERTLHKMARGGIYDQLGGGFHRYSVDAHWLVPHFEKMLYDNALLSRTYLQAFLLTGKSQYRRIVEETLDYVLREMTSPEGGFFSTQDADSDGEEGRFYTWDRQEVESLLARAEAELFCGFYGIAGEGPLEGRHVLHVPETAGTLAQRFGVSEEDLWQRIGHVKSRIFDARETRIRPVRDEKILTAWNGLMLKSFAEASQVLNRRDYLDAAIRCAEFVLTRLEHSDGLLHCHINGQARIDAFLDDYAFFADGLLSLYESTFHVRWLREATRLLQAMTEQFEDRSGIGFFMTNGKEALIQRPKEFYDNATPSGNSVAAHALLRVTEITGDENWAGKALPVLKALASTTARHPAAFGHLLGALDFMMSNGPQIAVVGTPGDEATQSLLREVFRRYLPNRVLVCGEDESLFLLRGRTRIAGRATAYLCLNQVCQAPVISAAGLSLQLDRICDSDREAESNHE
jgi:uncharacterized protein YyaL (SSP411 family)